MDDFIVDYLLEFQEGLAQFENELLELEKAPESATILSSMFRIVHSLKGSSGFLGFQKMAQLAHEGEDLLGRLRDGRLRLSPQLTSGLLAMVDGMRSRLSVIEATRAEDDRDDSDLLTRLRNLQAGVIDEPPLPTVPPKAPIKKKPKAPAESAPALRSQSAAPPPAPSPPARTEAAQAPLPVTEPANVDRGDFESEQAAIGGATIAGATVADTTIRVDVALLDKLMNLVGELVLTRNQLLRSSVVGDEAMQQASTQRLNLITTELQEGMMKTRMQPIRNVWSKLPRVVRDLALACGKQARLVTDGEETELDKTIVEAIKDPLTHIVRNAVDHGIEPPEVRAGRGKPAEGTLRLRAYHEGGMVNIEVSDDGGGIDSARIRRKAIDRGWIGGEQGAAWSDRELFGLIFRPGFSTAESLTMVSGRGVGMDVVKSRVEAIGGSVEVQSRLGEGTTIKLKIPLTLTIINALIVSSGGDRFAIPQGNLIELIRLHGEALGRSLASVHGAAVCRYRGGLLPLLDLNQILKIAPDRAVRDTESLNIVVLQADDQRFGLIVDRIDDAQEIVVRPLARQLKGIACLAGATIMGDGRIALILDVFGLALQLSGEHQRTAATSHHEVQAPVQSGDDRRPLLLLLGTDGSPFAVPLEQVDRLEAFPSSTVEVVGDRPLVQYRGTFLPLIDAADWLAGRASRRGERGSGREETPWQVVIHAVDERRVGLVFDGVLDVFTDRITVAGEPSRRGVLYTAALQGKATEVLDVPTIVQETLRSSVFALEA